MCVSSLLFALRSGRTLFSCIHFFLVFYSPLPHTLSPPRVVALCACVYLNPIGKDGRQRTSLDFGYHLLSIHRSCYLPSFRRAELDRSSRPVQDEKISDPWGTSLSYTSSPGEDLSGKIHSYSLVDPHLPPPPVRSLSVLIHSIQSALKVVIHTNSSFEFNSISI